MMSPMRFPLVTFLGALATTSWSLAQAPQPVVLEAATDREIYHANLTNTVYVGARIGCPGMVSPGDTPEPCNLAFVLDRSGSMTGEPMQELAKAVAAATALLGPTDFVSVVFFGSEVETLIEAQSRSGLGDIGPRLASVEAGGGTALYDALNQGAAQLRRVATKGRVSHLILVTDGPPSKGPRELADFTRLVESFAREGITVSTIGLGADCSEDMLATVARTGGGVFRYAERADKLAPALAAEVASVQRPVGYDALLTVEFARGANKVTAHGWEMASIQNDAATYRFQHLYAGRECSVLVSADFSVYARLSDVATVRLRWSGAVDHQVHETSRKLTVDQSGDARFVRDSVNADVLLKTTNVVIAEGLQQAIEMIDKGNLGRALTALRRARDDAVGLNIDLEDKKVAARIEEFDRYIAAVRLRGMSRSERKILRSGVFNEFATPVADESKK